MGDQADLSQHLLKLGISLSERQYCFRPSSFKFLFWNMLFLVVLFYDCVEAFELLHNISAGHDSCISVTC